MAEPALDLYKQVWEKVDSVGDFAETDANAEVDPEKEATIAIEQIREETSLEADLITSERFAKIVYLRKKWETFSAKDEAKESLFHACGVCNLMRDSSSEQKMDLLQVLHTNDKIPVDDLVALVRVFRGYLFAQYMGPAWFYANLKYFAASPLLPKLKQIKGAKLANDLSSIYDFTLDYKSIQEFFKNRPLEATRILTLMSDCPDMFATGQGFKVEVMSRIQDGRNAQYFTELLEELGEDEIGKIGSAALLEILDYRPTIGFIKTFGAKNFADPRSKDLCVTIYRTFPSGTRELETFWKLAEEFVVFLGVEQVMFLNWSRLIMDAFIKFTHYKKEGLCPKAEEGESQATRDKIDEAAESSDEKGSRNIESARVQLSRVLEDVNGAIINQEVERIKSREIPTELIKEVTDGDLIWYLSKLNKNTKGGYQYTLRKHPGVIDITQGGANIIDSKEGTETVYTRLIRYILSQTEVKEGDDGETIAHEREKAKLVAGLLLRSMLQIDQFRWTQFREAACVNFIDTFLAEDTFEISREFLADPHTDIYDENELTKSYDIANWVKEEKRPEVKERIKKIMKKLTRIIHYSNTESIKAIFSLATESDENMATFEQWIEAFLLHNAEDDRWKNTAITREKLLEQFSLTKSGYWFFSSCETDSRGKKHKRILREINGEPEKLEKACAFLESYGKKEIGNYEEYRIVYNELIKAIRRKRQPKPESVHILQNIGQSREQITANLKALFDKFGTLFAGLQKVPRDMAKAVEELERTAAFEGRHLTEDEVKDAIPLRTYVEPIEFTEANWKTAYMHLLRDPTLRKIFLDTLAMQVEEGDRPTIESLEVVGRCWDIWLDQKHYFAEPETFEAVDVVELLTCKNPEAFIGRILDELNIRKGMRGRPVRRPEVAYRDAIRARNEEVRERIKTGEFNEKIKHKKQEVKRRPPGRPAALREKALKGAAFVRMRDDAIRRAKAIVDVIFTKHQIPKTATIPEDERELALFLRTPENRIYLNRYSQKLEEELAVVYELMDEWNSHWYAEAVTLESMGLELLYQLAGMREKMEAMLELIKIRVPGGVKKDQRELAKKKNHSLITGNNAKLREYIDANRHTGVFRMSPEKFRDRIRKDLNKAMKKIGRELPV